MAGGCSALPRGRQGAGAANPAPWAGHTVSPTAQAGPPQPSAGMARPPCPPRSGLAGKCQPIFIPSPPGAVVPSIWLSSVPSVSHPAVAQG